MHEICACVCVYGLKQGVMIVGSDQSTSPFPFCCKLQTTITIVHIFNINTMNITKKYMQFCTAST
jgi:hypothetical protein